MYIQELSTEKMKITRCCNSMVKTKQRHLVTNRMLLTKHNMDLINMQMTRIEFRTFMSTFRTSVTDQIAVHR